MTDSQQEKLSSTIRIDIIPDLAESVQRDKSARKATPPSGKPAIPARSVRRKDPPLGGPDFQEFLQRSYDAALVTNTAGVVIESNARASEFLGYARQDLLRRNISTIISGWNPELLSTVQQTLESDRYVLLQAHCARQDGTLFPGEIASIRLHVSGRLCFCFFIRDITRRRQIENRLRVGFNAIENAGDGILITDKSGNVAYANPAAARLWSKDREDELTGKNLRELLNDPQAINAAMQAVEARQTWSGELLALRDGPEEFHVRLSVAPNVDDDDEWIGTVLSVEDINDRKMTERKLRRTMEDLARSNADLQEFAYAASHDLQEPLRKITVFSDLLRRRAKDVLEPEAAGHLDQIESSARRMSELIHGILDLSRISTQARDFSLIDLGLAARDVVADLELRVQEADATIDIGELPVIEAECIQMRVLFQNLIGNALKFRRKDVRPHLKIYARAPAAAPGQDAIPLCEIVVEDNGIGFDPAHAERIFGLFQRLHTRREYEGTGIGLAMCRKIARLHGGEIRAESQPGAGARFFITLPIRRSPASGEAG